MIEARGPLARDGGKTGNSVFVLLCAFIIIIVFNSIIGFAINIAMTSKDGHLKASTLEQNTAVGFLLRPISPIITNIKEPASTWNRLELALKFSTVTPPHEIEKIAALMAEDSLAFLRTITLGHIEGSTGLRHLREDILERAVVRSEGKVKEVIITSMVVQ